MRDDREKDGDVKCRLRNVLPGTHAPAGMSAQALKSAIRCLPQGTLRMEGGNARASKRAKMRLKCTGQIALATLHAGCDAISEIEHLL